jgi:hypothetical protein
VIYFKTHRDDMKKSATTRAKSRIRQAWKSSLVRWITVLSAFVVALAAFTDALERIHDLTIRLIRRDLPVEFNYLDWEAKPWHAKVKGEAFVIAPKDAPENSQTVPALKYVTWNHSKWEAMIKDSQFAHMQPGNYQSYHLDDVLNYLDWEQVPRQTPLIRKTHKSGH